MGLTKADVAALGRKQQRPVRAEGELLAVFVPGKVVNPLNASAWMWQKRSRLAKQWKERVALALLEDYRALFRFGNEGSRRPKRVTFLARTWNTLDTDGLAASIKPLRDALIECGVIHSDAPGSGHEFVYAQTIDRARRGVEIRVRPVSAPAVAGAAGAAP